MAWKKYFLNHFFSRNLVTSIETKTVFSRDTTHASKFVFDFFSKDQLWLLRPKQIVAWQLAEELISFDINLRVNSLGTWLLI